MTHRHNRTQWDDQELHKLFAARLPVLAIPDDFAKQLVQSVLQELVHHVEQKIDLGQDDNLQSLASTSIPTATSVAHENEYEQAKRPVRSAARRKRVPPAIL